MATESRGRRIQRSFTDEFRAGAVRLVIDEGKTMGQVAANSLIHPDPLRRGLRTVAVFEAAKGLLVLLAGFGLLTLLHKDVQAVAERFVERLHLNPAKHYPHIFIDAVSRVTDARLWLLAWLALCYAVVRLVEAYGLWRKRRWAQWFAVISGGVYVPMEVYGLAHGVTWIKGCTLTVNIAIVTYMTYVLWRSARDRVG